MSWRPDSSSDRLPLQDYSGCLARVIRFVDRLPYGSLQRYLFRSAIIADGRHDQSGVECVRSSKRKLRLARRFV